jgi:hypothetical protein
MGLRIEIHAPLAKREIEDVFAEIEAGLNTVVTDPILKAGMRIEREEVSLLAFLHPANEPVFFDVADGKLTCSAKTSGAGPGFHAWLVDTLEALDRATTLRWNWTAGNGCAGDESGYHERRDMALLQQEMAKWLALVGEQIIKLAGEEYGHIGVSMPLGVVVEGEYFTCSSLGYWTRDWFKDLVGISDPVLLAATAREFFPWWQRELDASFYKNHGLVLMWCQVAWRRPAGDEADDEQCRVVELAIASFQKARELDPAIELPPEVDALPALLEPLSDEEPELPPEGGGIGYCKGLLSRGLPGEWRISIPGYFRSAWNPNMGQMAFYFGTRSVQVSTFSHPHAAPHCYSHFRDVDGTTRAAERLEFEKGHLKGVASLSHLKDHDDDPGYWNLVGRVVGPYHMSRINITFADDAEKEWADQIWRTLFRPLDANNDDGT